MALQTRNLSIKKYNLLSTSNQVVELISQYPVLSSYPVLARIDRNVRETSDQTGDVV